MAATATDMLLKRIDADGPFSSRVELATQLVVRESTRSVAEASRG
jgi:DNA-binding LacI/PurR family transcriptional regulator